MPSPASTTVLIIWLKVRKDLESEDQSLVEPGVSNHAGVLARVVDEGPVDDDDGSSFLSQGDYLHPRIVHQLYVSYKQLVFLSYTPRNLGPQCLKQILPAS